MGSTEDADMLALIAAAPELATPDDTEIFLDAVPIPELASMWSALFRVRQTHGDAAQRLDFGPDEPFKNRIEREAAADKRFHDLLGGIRYYRAPDELKARLDALAGQNRW